MRTHAGPLGGPWPVSQWDTVSRVTPSLNANCGWVMRKSRRSLRIASGVQRENRNRCGAVRSSFCAMLE